MQISTFTKAIIFYVALSLATIATAAENKTTVLAENPTPFGLVFGKTTTDEAIKILQKEGGHISMNGNRVIKGDIVNPRIEAYYFVGVKLDRLQSTEVWFLDGVLMNLNYNSLSSFRELDDQLTSQYGKPSKHKTNRNTGAGEAIWKFKDVELNLNKVGIIAQLRMEYTHLKLYKEAEKLDAEILAAQASKPKPKNVGF